MGVSELWPLLKAVGITQVWSGLEGTHAQVVKEVDNKSIAIDLKLGSSPSVNVGGPMA